MQGGGTQQVDVPQAQAVFVVDATRRCVLAMIRTHVDTVICMCPLPAGGLATGGGKKDGKVQLWAPSQWAQQGGGQVITTPIPTLGEPAFRLHKPGYCFAMVVLPDAKPGSDLFALAAARYAHVDICL